jgi:uncharacterized protein
MSRTPYRALAALAVVAGWLAAAVPVSAMAVAPKINDEAKFFSDEAREKADKLIREIHHDFGRDLLIETFATVPANLAKDVDLKDKEARSRFFEKWARERAREADVKGIYILICKSPGHIEVEVGNETQKKEFTNKDRIELTKILIEKFDAKQYDEGLLDAVNFVGRRLKANGARSAAPAVIPGAHNEGGGLMATGLGGLLCVGLIILAGIWLVVGLFRALTGAGRGYGPRGYGPGGPGPGGYGPGGYGPGYGGGGGGFMSSLMGGLFGAAAGNWMYNSFFGGGHSSWGSGPGSQGGYGDTSGSDASRPDTDYSGGGGDFGGDDGGGGGGGGGDFGDDGGGGGGGDFGGGGGDFGGGGGGDF